MEHNCTDIAGLSKKHCKIISIAASPAGRCYQVEILFRQQILIFGVLLPQCKAVEKKTPCSMDYKMLYLKRKCQLRIDFYPKV